MESKHPIYCKIVLIGDSEVGKTAIISRYNSGCDTSTNGSSYASKILIFDELDKKIYLNIWDTQGQGKYYPLKKFFYNEASIAILIYDITLKQSFENIKNYWYPHLQEFAPKDIIIGVAGNNCHLYEKQEVDEYEAREFADKIGGFFVLVSAKNNTGINKLFMTGVQKFVNKKFKAEIKLKEKYKKYACGKLGKLGKLGKYLRF